MKSLQKEQNSTNILYYDPQSAGINVQSPQIDSTPRRLTLTGTPIFILKYLSAYNLKYQSCPAGQGNKTTY